MADKREIAARIVRIGMSLVFLWFGLNQLFQPDNFMGYLPSFILASDLAKQAILLNGAFNVVFGGLLLAGLFTRLVSVFLVLHLLSISVSLGYNDVMIRDIGLMFATASIYFSSPDKWTLDKRRRKY